MAATLQTGAVQEVACDSPGFARSTVISNRSTLVSAEHCDGQRIVPGDAPGNRLCPVTPLSPI